MKKYTYLSIFCCLFLSQTFGQSITAQKLNEDLLKSRDAFITYGKYKISSEKNFETLLKLDLLNQVFEKNPNINPFEAKSLLSNLNSYFPNPASFQIISHYPNEAIKNIFVDLVDSNSRIPKSLIKEFTESFVPNYSPATYKQFLAGITLSSPFAPSLSGINSISPNDNIEGILKAAAANSENPNFYQIAKSEFNKSFSGVTPFTSYKEILETDPQFASISGIKQIINIIENQNVNVDIKNEIKKHINLKLKEVTSAIENQNSILSKTTANQLKVESILKQAKNEQDLMRIKAELRKQAEIIRNEDTQIIAGINSSIYLSSTILKLIGEDKFANQLSIVGQASIKTYDAISKFNYISSLPNGKKWANNLQLSADFVSIGLSLASLFIDNGPSADQIILNQLQAIQKQINKVRIEMHERFDLVDKKLNLIYDNLSKALNEIYIEIQKNNFLIEDVRDRLISLDQQIYHLEDNLYTMLFELYNKDYLKEINNSLNLKIDREAISQEDFDRIRSEFINHATIYSRQDIATGQGNIKREYTPRMVARELQKFSFDYDLNYFNNYLSKVYSIDVPIKTIPNEKMWILGTSAYLNHVYNWPEQYITLKKAGKKNQIDNLRTSGLQILSAKKRLLNDSTKRQVIISKLFNNYSEVSQGFIAELIREEKRFIEKNISINSSENNYLEKSHTKKFHNSLSLPESDYSNKLTSNYSFPLEISGSKTIPGQTLIEKLKQEHNISNPLHYESSFGIPEIKIPPLIEKLSEMSIGFKSHNTFLYYTFSEKPEFNYTSTMSIGREFSLGGGLSDGGTVSSTLNASRFGIVLFDEVQYVLFGKPYNGYKRSGYIPNIGWRVHSTSKPKTKDWVKYCISCEEILPTLNPKGEVVNVKYPYAFNILNKESVTGYFDAILSNNYGCSSSNLYSNQPRETKIENIFAGNFSYLNSQEEETIKEALINYLMLQKRCLFRSKIGYNF